MLLFESISLPTPFLVGTVNCYLIKNDPITLVDSGVNSKVSLEALKYQLNKLGLTVSDIKRILITHAHVDHYGLAATLREISGANVYIHGSEMYKAVNRPMYIENVVTYLAFCGLPEELQEKLAEYFRWESNLEQPLEGAVEIKDGYSWSFDSAELTAVLTPGHSIGHLCFHEKAEGLLFSGDTILGHMVSKTVFEPGPEEPHDRSQGLLHYMNSIKRLKGLSIKKVLPGHGNPISDVTGEFLSIRNYHRRKKMRILEIIKQSRCLSPYDIAHALYPKTVQPDRMYLAISEVLGYLDLLKSEEEIEEALSASGLLIIKGGRQGAGEKKNFFKGRA